MKMCDKIKEWSIKAIYAGCLLWIGTGGQAWIDSCEDQTKTTEQFNEMSDQEQYEMLLAETIASLNNYRNGGKTND